MNSKALALSLTDLTNKDKSLLSSPISTLAKHAGLRVNDVYDKLIPALAETKSLYEALQFADIGLKYATMVDQNRLREEIGIEFVTAIDLIINLVREGLDDDEGAIKRKAMLIHKELINEYAEKKRFIETIMTEDKLVEIAAAMEAQQALEKEIVDI